MFYYEIKAFDRRPRSIFTMFAICPSDVAAIVLARDFAYKGQAVEVWRDDRIVYRVGIKPDHARRKSASPAPGPRKHFRLPNFLQKLR